MGNICGDSIYKDADRDPKQGTLTISFEPSDVKNWRKHLETEGYAVLKGVLSKQDVAKARDLYFDWLESLESGIERDDVSTWKTAAWPGPSYWGCLPTHGGGQTEAAWSIRSHPNVIQAFRDVWDTDE